MMLIGDERFSKFFAPNRILRFTFEWRLQSLLYTVAACVTINSYSPETK